MKSRAGRRCAPGVPGTRRQGRADSSSPHFDFCLCRLLGVPEVHRSGIKEAGCIRSRVYKTPGREKPPPSGRKTRAEDASLRLLRPYLAPLSCALILRPCLPPRGRRLFPAGCFIHPDARPTKEGSTENRSSSPLPSLVLHSPVLHPLCLASPCLAFPECPARSAFQRVISITRSYSRSKGIMSAA